MTDSSNGFRSVLDRLVVDQLVDGLPRRQRREARDFLGRGAEAGALDEMRGAPVIPVGRGDRRQVAGPGRRPGGDRIALTRDRVQRHDQDSKDSGRDGGDRE